MDFVNTMEPARSVTMAKRERLNITRIEGTRNRVVDEKKVVLWYDTKGITSPADAVFTKVLQSAYSGLVLYPDNVEALAGTLSDRFEKILHVESADEVRDGFVIASSNPTLLDGLRGQGRATCFRAYVDDKESLHSSIVIGSAHSHLMISFRDPTNIPLELVIATLQATQTILIKELTKPNDIDDAIVTLGVMEVGADGVMFSPKDFVVIDQFLTRLSARRTEAVEIQVGTIVKSEPVGMGYRSCIDLATIFSPTEGMLVGSTSQGGVLCCPEVFFLPYMELRPFRVNAGAVHSYVYNVNNKTDYMTELQAGSPVMVTDIHGKIRKAVVGRMKTEVRPLRLIEVEFAKGERVNVLMQDDWHVRIFSAEGKPLNITELKVGDKVLGHVGQPGRHVGIKVDEHIIEK